MGAIMLRKPRSLAKMVAGIVRESELPVTVKIRLGAEKVRGLLCYLAAAQNCFLCVQCKANKVHKTLAARRSMCNGQLHFLHALAQLLSRFMAGRWTRGSQLSIFTASTSCWMHLPCACLTRCVLPHDCQHESTHRYRRPADWGLIQEVVAANPELPIIGNGDLLTHYDATRRLEETGYVQHQNRICLLDMCFEVCRHSSQHQRCLIYVTLLPDCECLLVCFLRCHAVMTGRGALIRPWIFEEFKQVRECACPCSLVFLQVRLPLQAHI